VTAQVHRREAAGPTDRGDLLFALGWGNRPGHDPVDWLLDGLTDAGWTVHAVEFPENGTDFERDYLAPLSQAREEVDPTVCAGHSLGGLTLSHLPGDDARVYSAPFWGFGVSGVTGRLLPLVARIPSDRRSIPVQSDPTAIGDLKPTNERAASEDGVSPDWLSAMRRAQRSLPAFRPGSVVFCSLTDRVVSTSAIGRRAPADQVRLYDGGHEFFASTGRESTLERFCDALDAVANDA
jgi:hypothetical protein